MTFWIIEPRDPLIVRDGRPFGPNPGARAATLPFPYPSTIVGALRQKAGLGNDEHFDVEQRTTVLAYGIRGPLLVELDDKDTVVNWLLAAPADALLLAPEAPKSAAPETQSEPATPPTLERRWLAPRSQRAITSLPADLELVGPSTRVAEKVSTNAPRFWNRDAFWHWLLTPGDDMPMQDTLGIRSLETNSRMHVSVDPDQQTAREGALFQTSGLEFTWRDWREAERGVFVTKRFALAAWFDAPTPSFEGGLSSLGGERRLMRWTKDEQAGEPFTDAQREKIFQQIEADRQCRVILLTPGHFNAGYRPPPEWQFGGVAATVVAAAVPRMQTASGWDLAKEQEVRGRVVRGAPKPTRRLAPAGSVYYVTLPEGNIRPWLEAMWMQNVSDDAQGEGLHEDQHRRDGFGLAVLGVWPKEGGS